jgi:DNA ligase-1
VRSWQLEIDGSRYRSISGLLDGAKVESGWTACEGKNLGKKNATTGETQAQAEVKAEYKKKLKTGYFEDIADIDKGTILWPMLAFKYKDLKKGLDWSQSWWSQPKLDGIRNLARPHGNFSRTGEPTLTFPDVTEALQPLFQIIPGLNFDGELYSHELGEDLPQINSLVRKKNPTNQEIEKAQSLLAYHLYDVYIESQPDMPFDERIGVLDDLFAKYLEGNPLFDMVVSARVLDQATVDKLYDDYRRDGYEGQILRTGSGVYQPDKRPKDLVKRKEYVDAEFEVVDILEGNGNWAGAAKTVVYKNPRMPGDTFESGLAGTYEDNAVILREKAKYLGGEGTVTYFKYSPKGVPVQGVTKALYEGKRDV